MVHTDLSVPFVSETWLSPSSEHLYKLPDFNCNSLRAAAKRLVEGSLYIPEINTAVVKFKNYLSCYHALNLFLCELILEVVMHF